MTTEALTPAAEPAIATGGGGQIVLPQVIVDAGPQAVGRFLEFFAGRIANARTRAAYGRAVGQFLRWCEARGLELSDVSPLHVAAYTRTHFGSVPTVKQHLAAIGILGDWLVVSQVLPVNPAAAVRGPKHVVTKGATPVLSPAEARRLLESIDTSALAGLRDRALLSVMLYSFARGGVVHLEQHVGDSALPASRRQRSATRSAAPSGTTAYVLSTRSTHCLRRSRRRSHPPVSRAPISAAPSSANAWSASRTAAVSSPSCASQARAASRYVLPTSRSWFPPPRRRNISHSTAQTARIARRRLSRELAEPVGEVGLPSASAAA